MARRKIAPYAKVEGFILFDRVSNYPDGNAGIIPKDHKDYNKYATPGRQTYKEWYTEGFEHGWFRSDIGMLIAHTRECHCSQCLPTFKGKREKYESFRQLWIYPGSNEEPYGEGWLHCSDQEREQLRDLNRRMVELAKDDPIYARAMHLNGPLAD